MFQCSLAPEHSLSQLHRTSPNCEPDCDLTAHSAGWCNVALSHPRRRRALPLVVIGSMEEDPEYSMLSSWQLDLLLSANTVASGGQRAPAAREPILCYWKMRDHSSTHLFAQAHSIDFLISGSFYWFCDLSYYGPHSKFRTCSQHSYCGTHFEFQMCSQ